MAASGRVELAPRMPKADDQGGPRRLPVVGDELMDKTGCVAADVGELIEALNDPSGVGEDAKHELIARGVSIVPQLARRIGGLSRFGKLTAIETLESLEDPRACAALIGLLFDEADTVVEWSASALGVLGCRDAVEPLRDVWARSVAAQVPPGWTEPVALRRALTDLGARQPVLPNLTAGLLQQDPASEMQFVPSAHLAEAIDDLADHAQVVLGFTLWRVAEDGRLSWTRGAYAVWEFAWSAKWVDSVTSARREAHSAAKTVAPELLVHLEWVDESDLTVGTNRGG